ncbi:MAG: hypothetical protein AMJ88_08240 [Anaerolineae bacterium SM23_ 63]|nr:MAG: hypothetical protein AMJ88_08240 [Anaerolineae bacterium SM23_ 63]HEY46716.1 hypothetical protein [Anaerolineae bacterium]
MSASDSQEDGERADLQRALMVKERYGEELMGKANVQGVGIGLHMREGKPTGGLSLVVLVSHKVPKAQLAPEDLIPNEIEGVSVDVQEVGELEVQD